MSSDVTHHLDNKDSIHIDILANIYLVNQRKNRSDNPLVISLLYTLTALLALIGNGLVCRLSFQRKHSTNLPLSTTRIVLLNLALADALAGLTILCQFLFCSKYLLEHLTISLYLCIVSKSIQILAYNTSMLIICVIAFDRYRIIQDPLKQYYHRNTRRSILLTWILSGLFAGTCFISMQVHTYFIFEEKSISCQIFFASKSSDFISILCILTMRTIARRSIISVRPFPTFQQSRTHSIRLLIIIATIFALSYLPVHFLHIQDFFITSSNHYSRLNKCNDTTMYLFFYWLSISSCCHNP